MIYKYILIKYKKKKKKKKIKFIDMVNIFEAFLPQLLRYPNPTDPLNGDAAALLMREPTAYEQKVRGI